MAECGPTCKQSLQVQNRDSPTSRVAAGLDKTSARDQPNSYAVSGISLGCPCHYKRSFMDLTVSSRSSLNSHKAEGINHVIVKRQFLSQLCRNSQWGHHFRNERSIDGNRISSRIAERVGIRSVVTGVRAASSFPRASPR